MKFKCDRGLVRIPIVTMCHTGYKQKLEILSLALAIARVVEFISNYNTAHHAQLFKFSSPIFSMLKARGGETMLTSCMFSKAHHVDSTITTSLSYHQLDDGVS
jgi:hypothetical protein